MKFLSLCLLTLFAAFSGMAGENILNPSRAEVTKYAALKESTIEIDVPEKFSRGIHGVFFPIDLKPYRNQFVRFEVTGTGTDLSKPNLRYLGQKFMLNLFTPDGKKHYAESNGQYGSFGPKTLSFTMSIPSDADSGRLRFTIENVSGKMKYDLSTFRIVPVFVKKNADHICEYSDAVRNRPLRRGVMSPVRDQANEENFKVLKSWNVNLYRLQLNCWIKKVNDKAYYDAFINEKIEQVIPKVLALGEKYGIAVIIDLHMVPGGARDRNKPCIMDSEENVRRFVAIWERIARKFKGHPALYGYDLMNEPDETRPVRFGHWEIQRMAAEAIRKIDPETPIYLESNRLCSQYTFDYLSPLKLKNIIYQVHSYDPFLYTHQPYTEKDRRAGKKPVSYPGKIGGADWDRESFRMRMAKVRAFQLKHKAKIFVGEFSVKAWAPGAEKYLEDNISVFEEYGWDWTYHAFREAKIWSLEHEGTADDALIPSKDNPRKRVLLNAFRKNGK